jgi:hypothetical protein
MGRRYEAASGTGSPDAAYAWRRRAEPLADDRSRVVEGWRQIQDESQGLLRVAIIDVEDVLAHLDRAMESDVESRRLIVLVDGTFKRLGGNGLVCLLCGAALSLTALPRAIVAIHGGRDDFKQAATSGLCRACFRRHQSAAGLATAVHEFLRANLLSDFRVLPPMAPGGHA